MNIVLSTSGALRNPKESAYLTTLSTARELQKQGHRVLVVTERRTGLPAEEKVEEVVFFHPYNLGILNKLLAHPLAISSLQRKYKLKVDLIHSFSASPFFALNTFLAGLVAWRAKKVHTLRSYPRRGGRLWGAVFLNLADKVTVPTATFARKLWSVLPGRIEVVHSPVNLQKFFPRKNKDKLILKNQQGYGGKKVVLYYGAMTRNKGIPFLLDAMAEIVRQRKDVRFLFLPRHAGIGHWNETIERRGMNEYAQIITQDVPIEDYVNLADAVALPYLNLWGTDGNPSCLLEALACGIPVVTTDFPELREITEGAAEFVTAGDVHGFAQKLELVLDHPPHQKIKKGVEIVHQFTPEIIVRKMTRLYSALVSVR